MNPCLLVFGASASQPTLIKAVARFLITGVGGIIASAEGPSLLGGSWRYFPPETFQIWRLRNAIFITPKNRPRISVKRQVFSCSTYIEYTKHLQQFETVHLQANFIGGFCFLLLTICTHRPWTKQFLGHENGKQLQVTTIKTTASKENISIHKLDLSGSTGPGGAQLPRCPPLATALLIPLNLAFFISLTVSKFWFARSAS